MSQRDSGYLRREHDLYETPRWVTQALLPELPQDPRYRRDTAWEPACGYGPMAEVMRGAYQNVLATDLIDYGYGQGGCDFLQYVTMACESIITNPPYDLAQAFIEQALRLTEPMDGLVAMLLRTDYDHAQSRQHLFKRHPAFWKKLVLTKRIQWFTPAPGEKGQSPSFNHAWFIWWWRNDGAPTLAYGP